MTIRNLFLNLDVILLAKLRIIFYFANFFSLYFYKKVAITRLFRAMATLFRVILGLLPYKQL